MSRLPFFLALVLLFSLHASATINLGAEREIAPSTTAVRLDASSSVLAASHDGFLSVWHNWEINTSFYTRLDASGRSIDDVGVRLPVHLPYFAAAWNGSEYVVAGFDFARGMMVMPLGGEARVIEEVYFGSDIRLVFNGKVLLLTWMTQTGLIQTLHGVLLEPDLDVVRAPFVVASRDVSSIRGILDHSMASSIAVANGGDFLVAWQLLPALTIVSETGEIRTGAPVPANALQPSIVATNSGPLLLWHDCEVLSAARVSAEGVSLSVPVGVVHAADTIEEFAATGDGAGLAVVWRTTSDGCDTSPLFARSFDAALAPVGEIRTLAAEAGWGIGVVADETVVATWVEYDEGCFSSRGFARTATIAPGSEPAQTISAYVAPSSQKDVDIASDGVTALTIWSERRDSDSSPRVYGAILDANGNVQRTLDVAAGENGRVTAGDGRYLLAWQQGTTIAARFLDAEPFAVVPMSLPFEVAWNGEYFVFVWNDGASLRSAFVISSGFVTIGPTIENAGPLAAITAGPHGEIAAVFAIETAQQVEVRVAVLRAQWQVEPAVAVASRPCFSKRCKAYDPVAIGWNGRDYLIVWKVSDGPPYGSVIEGHLLRARTTTRIANAYSYFGGLGGELTWNGSNFLFVLDTPGIEASWPLTYVARLSESGVPLAPLTRLSVTEVSGPPVLALVRPDRAIVAYTRKTGLAERAYTRVVDFTTPPRRRSARH